MEKMHTLSGTVSFKPPYKCSKNKAVKLVYRDTVEYGDMHHNKKNLLIIQLALLNRG